MRKVALMSCLVPLLCVIVIEALPAEVNSVQVEDKSRENEVTIKKQPVIDLEVAKKLPKLEGNAGSDEAIETLRRPGGNRGSASGLASLSFVKLLTFLALVRYFSQSTTVSP